MNTVEAQLDHEMSWGNDLLSFPRKAVVTRFSPDGQQVNKRDGRQFRNEKSLIARAIQLGLAVGLGSSLDGSEGFCVVIPIGPSD